ncbi:MAG: hypothetical protein IPP77_01945 [Bacteroidetes bacterium]|nr:hypothetical protein [Bacteroidota bacterium]
MKKERGVRKKYFSGLKSAFEKNLALLSGQKIFLSAEKSFCELKRFFSRQKLFFTYQKKFGERKRTKSLDKSSKFPPKRFFSSEKDFLTCPV